MCEDGLHDPFTDQVECARYRAERDALAQRMEEVASEIDRTLSGVEGIEDAPAMRWMRGLREALGALHSPRTSYEDIEAARWVHEHGGLDHVREEWSIRSNLKRMYEKEKAKAERQQRHIEFVQGKCRERQGHIVDLNNELAELRKVLSDYSDALGGMCERLGITDGTSLPEMPDVICEALDRRLMPEGMEWPRYEDGEPVRIGDEYECWCGDTKVVSSVTLREGRSVINESQMHSFVVSDGPFTSNGKRVRRPSVPASDGKALEVGQTVWDANGDELVVGALEDGGNTVTCRYADVGDGIPVHGMWSPSDLTHQRPAPKVLDADGAEIRVGDTVYLLPGDWCDKFPCYGYHGAEELEVFSLHADHVEGGVGCRDTRRPKGTCYPQPSQLTHRAPVLAADGRPLREGEHVYHVETGAELVVKELPKPGEYQAVVVFALPTSPASHLTSFDPDRLTHERPDSWERLEEDAEKDPCGYFGFDGEEPCGKCPASGKGCEQTMALDIVRRAKALAERERGE